MPQLIKHGTTTASSFCTIHKESVEAFFTESKNRNMLMIAGKVMMDRNAPPKLLDTPQSSYDDTKKLIAEINSTKKYSKFILVKQCLHLALSIMKESNGILSYQFIFLLQDTV